MAPARPLPMARSSIRVTGLSSRVVLVMKASSAVSRSAGTQGLAADLDADVRADLEQERAGDPLEQAGF